MGKNTVIRDFLDYAERVFPEATMKLVTYVHGIPFARCASIAELRTQPKYKEILESKISKYEESYEMGERIIELYLK